MGRDHEVILTHKLWKRLGGNPHIIGETLRVNAEPYTVVGVLAPGLFDRGQGDIAVPLAFKSEQLNHDFHWLLAMGRLKPGGTMEQARADMNAVTTQIAQQYPRNNKGWGAFVEPLKNDFSPPERIRTLWMLLGAAPRRSTTGCTMCRPRRCARCCHRQRLAARTRRASMREAVASARARRFFDSF